MRHPTRGTALPETALMVGLVLMLLFATVRLAIVGFFQTMADGGAFVAAHTLAVNPQATNVQQIVASTFPKIAVGDVALNSPNPGFVRAVVTKSVGGLLLVPGAAANIALHGENVAEVASAAASPPPYGFSVTSTLRNYCPPPGNAQGINCTATPYAIVVAQHVDTTTTAQGWNGTFAEWRCHQQFLAKVNFPNSRPTPGPDWNPNDHKSTLNPVYQWDTGSPC